MKHFKTVILFSVILLILGRSSKGFGAAQQELKLTSASVYNLESTWTSQNKKTIQLKEFLGKQVLIAMVYTSCQHTCPFIISKIRDLEKKNKEIKIVLVSFDVKRDTPEALKAYSKKMKLTDNWTLLTGQEADIRSLAAVLGVNFKKDNSGEISHSNVISLLDSEGAIEAQILSLNDQLDPILKKIK